MLGEHTVESGDHGTPPAGSYGNASPVTWTSLTDNQATLAVGSIALQANNVPCSIAHHSGKCKSDGTRGQHKVGSGLAYSTSSHSRWFLPYDWYSDGRLWRNCFEQSADSTTHCPVAEFSRLRKKLATCLTLRWRCAPVEYILEL
jgi:hypothetical protein